MCQSLLDAFKWRHSVRSYTSEFTQDQDKAVRSAVEEANGWDTPFHTNTLLAITNRKVDYYGYVLNDIGCILALVPKNLPEELKYKSMVDVSFRAQIAVMRISQHKIGTVWLGGTFNRQQAGIDFPDYEILVCIPYGNESPNLTPTAKNLMKSIRPDTRKPIEKLFYNVQEKKSYTEETSGELLPMFTAIRWGPSAINQQGWTFAVDGKEMHVYYDNSMNYIEPDTGIALGNIALLLKEKDIEPKFYVKETPPPSYLGGSYVCSCVIQK
ncbi:nitroreductase [Histomonas meleagridis]|uniref:nitroreductase n=1 Tax=Histomonas meleagridis TaxID=135588 RepID=UPI00355AB626|nr:nitroreductase [Histomonas meleagridis]KAH0801257.1 nitroreductase [Histomonas meleagridis]